MPTYKVRFKVCLVLFLSMTGSGQTMTGVIRPIQPHPRMWPILTPHLSPLLAHLRSSP